jgi:transcriptional regulator with XRE-family HTH domain
VVQAGRLIKQARQASALTQTELARRLDVSQSVVARLESPRSNPRFATLARAIAATGHDLAIRLTQLSGGPVDETMIAANLRLDPAARLRLFASAYRSVRKLSPARRGGGP